MADNLEGEDLVTATPQGENLVTAAHQMMSDPSSPYYMHYGDNTGMQVVSVILYDENYPHGAVLWR